MKPGKARSSRRLRGWVVPMIAILIAFASAVIAALPEISVEGLLDRMRANATGIESLQARITVQTYKDGQANRTQEMSLSLLQPDKMRQEYLAPDYLAGNVTLVVGQQMWIYIAAADTWYEKDLAELSAAEQPWLLFRQILRNVQDEWNDYLFEFREDGGDPYHLVGTPRTEDAVYGAIELWVDPGTFVPTRRLLYDADGRLIVDVRVLDVAEVAPGVYLAQRVEAYDADGQLSSQIQYGDVVVNAPLEPASFTVPAEGSHG